MFSLLSKINKSKATGLDKIQTRPLGECPNLIAASLCSICNRSFISGIFPEELKCLTVIPLLKQGQLSTLITIGQFLLFLLLLRDFRAI